MRSRPITSLLLVVLFFVMLLSTVDARAGGKFVDSRNGCVDDHAQFGLIGTFWPTAAAGIDCADGEPVFAISFSAKLAWISEVPS